MTDARLRRRYFAGLLAAQVLVYAWLLLSHRMPRGHDTLSVLLLQYLFLAQPGSGAGVALWMPQFAHGMTSAWFANVQGGLLQNALLLFGGVPEGTPMLPIFYAGLFFEDLLLLIGVWRLGARFYRTPAAQFFVAAAAVGSSMWVSNIFWSHRLIFGVPLLLSFLLDFLETGRRGPVLLAASLGGLLLLGTAPYIPLLSGLSVVLFLVPYVLLHRKRLRTGLPLLRFRPADLFRGLVILAVVAVAVTAVLSDLGSIRQYQRARNPDGSVTLDTFLTYPGSVNPLRYADLALGLNVSTDFSLYAGLCTLLLALRAFTRRPRKDVLVLGISLLFILLFSMGYLSWVGMVGYEAIPPLRFFRYVGLSCMLVKLFVILLSGFGIDALIRESRDAGRRRIPAVPLTAAGLLLLQLLFRSLRSGIGGDTVSNFFLKIMGGITERQPSGTPGSEGWMLAVVGILALIAVRRIRTGSFPPGIPLLFFLHAVDLLGWRTQILREATVPLSPAQRAVLDVRPIPYAARRTPTDEGHPRAMTFGRELLPPNSRSAGTVYDYSDAFLHRDASWSIYFVTQWSPSIDLLLRARAGRSLSFNGDPPPTFVSGEPPRTRPEGIARVIGESEDKLQVYSTAHAARTDEEIAAVLGRADFQGGTLLLSADPGEPAAPLDPALATGNERLPGTPQVLEYRADRIRIEVDVPQGRSGAWLAYADCWHPGWRATVDGVPQAVRRANLAYKAVPLHAGRNVVEFRLHAPLRAACYGLVGLQCLGWTLGLIAGALHYLGILRPRTAARLP